MDADGPHSASNIVEHRFAVCMIKKLLKLPGNAIKLKFMGISKKSGYLVNIQEFLVPTSLSVRGSMAGLKSFPETSRIWGSVRGTFFLSSICILFAFSCIQGLNKYDIHTTYHMAMVENIRILRFFPFMTVNIAISWK